MKNTPSIELCKKLKEAGYSQRSPYKENMFYYLGDDLYHHGKLDNLLPLGDGAIKAPTVAELIDSLPVEVGGDCLTIKKINPGYKVFYKNIVESRFYNIFRDNLPNALAEMRLNLKEEGFIWGDDDDAKI